MAKAPLRSRGGERSPFAGGGSLDRKPPRVEDVLVLLEGAYEESSLGNKRNPLDELIYIILSLQTNESRYQDVYRRFKARFPRWADLLCAARRDIAAAIAEGGLNDQKARHVKGIAEKLERDFGEVSLRRLKSMGTEEAEAYLCSLPGVGIKTARCVLMYALGRDVFPADIHCLRVMARLGWISWRGERAEKFAGVAQAAVPAGRRMSLHIRLVQHGRAVCRSFPLCADCVLRPLCPSATDDGTPL
jgi:endonuclease III